VVSGVCDGVPPVFFCGDARVRMLPRTVLRTAGLSRQGFVVGAGAGAPQHTGGTVGEAMPNLLIDEEGRATRNLSAYSTWNEDHVWQVRSACCASAE